ncbi:hypothetical protein AALO_G00231450, partial [Alosa alosa]
GGAKFIWLLSGRPVFLANYPTGHRPGTCGSCHSRLQDHQHAQGQLQPSVASQRGPSLGRTWARVGMAWCLDGACLWSFHRPLWEMGYN